jgi:hypothetical protein
MLKKFLDKFLEIESYEKVIIILCGSFSMFIFFLMLRHGI